jgi:hypothetical protein
VIFKNQPPCDQFSNGHFPAKWPSLFLKRICRLSNPQFDPHVFCKKTTPVVFPSALWIAQINLPPAPFTVFGGLQFFY